MKNTIIGMLIGMLVGAPFAVQAAPGDGARVMPPTRPVVTEAMHCTDLPRTSEVACRWRVAVRPRGDSVTVVRVRGWVCKTETTRDDRRSTTCRKRTRR